MCDFLYIIIVLLLRGGIILEEDITLYKKFLAGDNNSFDILMDKHKNSLIYFIQRYVKVIEIAEDLAQDVFVYLLINKTKYNFDFSLKTYLYTIGKCRALDYLKREKKIVHINEDYLYSDDELEDEIFNKERAENLRKAITQLKPEYQSAIYLSDIENLKYKEICIILDKSMPQIKMLIHRARKNLEYILRKERAKYEG